MYKGKRVLLIAGGGTLGTYVSDELLRLGCRVDVVCLEDKETDNERLRFYKSYATKDFLSDLFSKAHYDGIINFLHYKNAADYADVHPFLMQNTDHLVFLSSYRVYADEQHPITEDAPRLYDVVNDRAFLENETYAVSKAKCEDYLFSEHKGENWTIVRPVISFSKIRLDLLLYSGDAILKAAESGEEIVMPEMVRDYGAGIDWAGNSGKLIANLLFKKEAMGEAFTVYSGHGATWGDVAEAYAAQTGVKICWCSEEEFLGMKEIVQRVPWMWEYDRAFDRTIDASKVLRVTGLSEKDFSSIEEGIRKELELLDWKRA